MSNANTSKRLNALIAAISALTVDDLESFSEDQVSNLRNLKRHSSLTCKDLEYEARRQKERAEEELRRKEQDRLRAERAAALSHLPTPVGVTAEEWEFIKKGQKINAIKLVRERVGCGLAEAKNHVEQVAYNMGYEGRDHGVNVNNYSLDVYPPRRSMYA